MALAALEEYSLECFSSSEDEAKDWAALVILLAKSLRLSIMLWNELASNPTSSSLPSKSLDISSVTSKLAKA